MFNPPALRGARTDINIPTRTLIVQSCFGQINLLDSVKPKQASINAFYFNSMFVLIPHSGDYSGTALDMRFIAYLHLFNVSE